MKTFEKKLDHLDPHHPEVTAHVIELIRSMTPEEAKEFLEYRTPGVPEYWLGKPIHKNGRQKTTKTKEERLAK